jgi:hypothetical protein
MCSCGFSNFATSGAILKMTIGAAIVTRKQKTLTDLGEGVDIAAMVTLCLMESDRSHVRPLFSWGIR